MAERASASEVGGVDSNLDFTVRGSTAFWHPRTSYHRHLLNVGSPRGGAAGAQRRLRGHRRTSYHRSARNHRRVWQYCRLLPGPSHTRARSSSTAEKLSALQILRRRLRQHRAPPPHRGIHPSIKEQHCFGTSNAPPQSRLATGELASALSSRRSEGRLQQPHNDNTGLLLEVRSPRGRPEQREEVLSGWELPERSGG